MGLYEINIGLFTGPRSLSTMACSTRSMQALPTRQTMSPSVSALAIMLRTINFSFCTAV